ncbi:MAG: endonuclease/exonuclease/phosphatase family protein [Gammaproteobacteria bacterium]|nr:endonuclease/exonuclease/phosphatase family protein [Gammaproteobacteria bacterium]MDE0248789.1 endonuclease/exonuclease/phosphatase family protein [Gammaproteobacteria bacterium]
MRGALAAAALLSAHLVLAAAVAGQDRDGPEPARLDVMTFNIRTAAGRDGANAWPNRKALVAETIARSSPDVVGLQEALKEQIEFLASRLSEYRWLGVDRGLNGGRGLSEATPIFYRHRELTPIESGTFWISETPEEPSRGRRRASRIVTWARFYHLGTGQQLVVYNTHFSLRQGAGHLRGTRLINERIATLPEGSAVVAMGDFNAVAERSETWTAATAHGLRDAWVIAGERRGPAITANGFGPPPDAWDGRIDWILVGGQVSVLAAETVVYSREGRFPSDHYPVLARLEIGR